MYLLITQSLQSALWLKGNDCKKIVDLVFRTGCVSLSDTKWFFFPFPLALCLSTVDIHLVKEITCKNRRQKRFTRSKIKQ